LVKYNSSQGGIKKQTIISWDSGVLSISPYDAELFYFLHHFNNNNAILLEDDAIL